MDAHPLEASLVRAAREGDRESFAELAVFYQGPLYGYCYLILRTRQDAEDAVQTTLLKALEYLDRLKDDTRFRPWLYRIATNVCLGEYRRVRRLSPLPDDDGPAPLADGGQGPTEAWDCREIHEVLQRALGTLSPIQSRALWLAYFEELPYASIGEILGIRPGTARKRVCDAVERLRHELQPYRSLL